MRQVGLVCLAIVLATVVAGCDSVSLGEGCPAGLTDCEGQCVDIDRDAFHCGGCGKACGDEQVCTDGACEDCPTIVVTDAPGLVSVIEGYDWGASPRDVTCNIEVRGEVTVVSPMIDAKSVCQALGGCAEQTPWHMGFIDSTGQGVQGVSTYLDTDLLLLAPEGFPVHDNSLTVKDVTVRLRGQVEDRHPADGLVPYVIVEPPAEARCPPGDWHCGVDRLCYSSSEGYCEQCLRAGSAACACFGVEGWLLDGTECEHWMSPDFVEMGVCRDRQCVAED